MHARRKLQNCFISTCDSSIPNREAIWKWNFKKKCKQNTHSYNHEPHTYKQTNLREQTRCSAKRIREWPRDCFIKTTITNCYSRCADLPFSVHLRINDGRIHTHSNHVERRTNVIDIFTHKHMHTAKVQSK